MGQAPQLNRMSVGVLFTRAIFTLIRATIFRRMTEHEKNYWANPSRPMRRGSCSS